MTKQWIDRHLDGEAKESAMVHEIKELRAKLAELEAQEPLGYTMTRPEEHAYSSHISYCRALEAYCDKIEAELAELGVQCSDHPDAPHGFDRTSSRRVGRYVCVCEGWVP